jgi:hypothetical protein
VLQVSYGRTVRVREVECEACGARVRIDFARDNVTSTRELASTPSPGRVTIRVGDEIVHQCEDGTFLPPENVQIPSRKKPR